jgi:hypothetical protein
LIPATGFSLATQAQELDAILASEQRGDDASAVGQPTTLSILFPLATI